MILPFPGSQGQHVSAFRTCHRNSSPIHFMGYEWLITITLHTQFSQPIPKLARFQVPVLYFWCTHLCTHEGAVNDPLTVRYWSIQDSCVLTRFNTPSGDSSSAEDWFGQELQRLSTNIMPSLFLPHPQPWEPWLCTSQSSHIIYQWP